MTGCLCLARDLNDGMIESYETASDGMVWGIWPECPIHHGRYKSPVWHPVSGNLRTETATADQAVAVEFGA